VKMTDFVEYLARQVAVSRCNFGPNERTLGVIDHIEKELKEIKAEDTPEGRAQEWNDVVLLALDGATRAMREAIRARGTLEPTADDIAREVVLAIKRKQQGKNELRDWPDWRTVPEDKAIEHKRGKHD
jgi:hypothetical protein